LLAAVSVPEFVGLEVLAAKKFNKKSPAESSVKM
jgi:hypothetical protein